MNISNTHKIYHRRKGVAQLLSDSPLRVIRRMCKHFSHRVPIKTVDGVSEIYFLEGTCYVLPEQSSVRFEISSESNQGFTLINDTLERHLSQFTQDKTQILWSYH